MSAMAKTVPVLAGISCNIACKLLSNIKISASIISQVKDQILNIVCFEIMQMQLQVHLPKAQ